MRIAQISTLATPVLPVGSGSVEGIIWLLTRELVRLGHEVTVFAAAGSETDGMLVETLPGAYAASGAPHDWLLCEWINMCRAVEQSDRFDVLHSHAYLWGIPLQNLSRAPMVHTMHVLPIEDTAKLWKMYPESYVAATSSYQWSGFPDFKPPVIYYGVDPAQFRLQIEPEDYVCFFGRFIPGKGPLQAIAAARALGLRLVMAGPRNDYYNHYIEPLVDGKSVEYIGSISGEERNKLLGGARALLYPNQSPEPFGLVQVEAMLCGTPVVATRIGAVPEIVDDGITGYWAESMEEFAPKVLQSFNLDRRRIREVAEARFAPERMAREYLEVYERAVQGGR
jgi:glycosyltransferase involved in cell wall biosynthesis